MLVGRLEVLPAVKTGFLPPGARSAPAVGGLNIVLSKFSPVGLGFKADGLPAMLRIALQAGGRGFVIQSGFCGLSFPRLGMAGINAWDGREDLKHGSQCIN